MIIKSIAFINETLYQNTVKPKQINKYYAGFMVLNVWDNRNTLETGKTSKPIERPKQTTKPAQTAPIAPETSNKTNDQTRI